jgi:hypothetical protein
MTTTGSILSVYLPGDLKPRWVAHCKRQDETPSSGIRQVIAYLLAPEEQLGVSAQIVRDQADLTRHRLELRLTKSELMKISKLADAQGLSPNRWVASLVRGHLTRQPQFGMVELTALASSNTALLSIGRNLNQVARRLNTGEGADAKPSVDEIRALSAFIKEHAAQVATVMRANVDRWTLV